MNIVFWSYKGGSGRSIAAANLAIRLSETKSVGIIDFDLEAPGLHTIFGIRPEDIHERGCLIDLFKSNSLVNLNSYIWGLNDKFKEKDQKERSLYLLPNIDDPIGVKQIDWNDENNVHFVSDLYNRFTLLYGLDFLLIDARSGFSDITAVATQLATDAILFFRPNLQHRDGILRALNLFSSAGINCILVASQVPDIPAAKGFMTESSILLNRKIDMVLPLVPEFAVGEKLLFKETECKELFDLYNELAKLLLMGKS